MNLELAALAKTMKTLFSGLFWIFPGPGWRAGPLSTGWALGGGSAVDSYQPPAGEGHTGPAHRQEESGSRRGPQDSRRPPVPQDRVSQVLITRKNECAFLFDASVILLS